jgi:uncharacterized protein YdiU (UPF0061 family)
MNTDNFSILGITIDYGPFQFLDAYDPTYVCNHSDVMGQYAFMEQPTAAMFNLIRLATALSPLLQLELAENQTVSDLAKPILDEYKSLLRLAYQKEMCKKFGFSSIDSSSTTAQLMESVIQPILVLMEEAEMDYTIFLRTLSEMSLEFEQLDSDVYQKWISCSYRTAADFKVIQPDSETGQSLETQFHIWYVAYRNAHFSINGGIRNDDERISFMKSINPKYILRNHIVQKVIEAVELQTSREHDNEKQGTKLIETYLRILQNPFQDAESGEDDAFFGGMVPQIERDIKCSCSS